MVLPEPFGPVRIVIRSLRFSGISWLNRPKRPRTVIFLSRIYQPSSSVGCRASFRRAGRTQTILAKEMQHTKEQWRGWDDLIRAVAVFLRADVLGPRRAAGLDVCLGARCGGLSGCTAPNHNRGACPWRNA